MAESNEGHAEGLALDRRRFVGYVVAAPTLAVAARVVVADPASAAPIATPDGFAEFMDLGELQNLAAAPTANKITIRVNRDGTVSFALPRSENGQGIVTSTAMIIAEEMDIPVKRVKVTLADARPELIWNQLTGGSNTTRSTYTPIRTAAAVAKKRLREAAARELGVDEASLRTVDGAVVSDDGRSLDYGALTEAAAARETTAVEVELKPRAAFQVIGKGHKRTDAKAAVTGKKKYAMDLKVKGAKPTMVCRPPTINGKVRKVLNRAQVLEMPGVTHVVTISTGVAVRARTFGQCIDAVRALKVDWGPGPLDGLSDGDILAELKAAEVPLAVPPLLGKAVDGQFTFWFAGNSALETNCAIADVRADRAEIWGPLKVPIAAKTLIAQKLKLPEKAVKVHVIPGGGSFGRKLFHDAAMEAAEASQKMGKPVKLMWHRADDVRQGRVHPMSTGRVRAIVLGNQVTSFEQRHTSVATDFSHGFGEIITAFAGSLPVGDLGFSQTIFALSQSVHYNFGVTTQLLNEVDGRFNTGAMRNIYSPNTAQAREVMVDKIAATMKKDPYAFRREFVRTPQSRAVLDKVATVGKWGRAMPAGMGQGLAIHNEYGAFTACLVEIDCRPKTVGRKVRDAVTGPRVTKVVIAVDIGLPINPAGLRAQMLSGAMDGIAMTLTSSLHLRNGYFLEASWDNYAYTRQWNTPPTFQAIIMPATSDVPGGAGELAVAPVAAAVATAYARATGTMPTHFPINHKNPLHFKPKPTVPPVPQSPVNGLDLAR
ncbi:MAG TPA: molybdopterin cofactor-binding domain-containing protein [Nocardioidaceae bacterium]|nr:molybdopterin cofactor-binding domain-containing protein [Nocardioidaceae bacterium]